MASSQPLIEPSSMIVAYVGDTAIHLLFFASGPQKNDGHSAAAAESSFVSALLGRFADENGIVATPEEITAKWKETGVSDEMIATLSRDVPLLLDGLELILKDEEAGEAFYHDQLSSFYDRELWEYWKRKKMSQAEIEKSRALVPRSSSEAMLQSTGVLTNQVRIAKARAAIVGHIDRTSAPVADLLRKGFSPAGVEHFPSKEDQAIAIVQQAVFFEWLKNEMRTPGVRIVDPAFAEHLEKRVRVAEEWPKKCLLPVDEVDPQGQVPISSLLA